MLASVALILIPVGVLALAAYRYESRLLAIGALAQVVGSVLFVRSRYAWRPPTSSLVICLYIIALGWVWFATHESADWFARLTRGLFLLIAVGLLVMHDMTRTGLEPRRRARVLCSRLLSRTRWPRSCEEYAFLPEVWGLRDAVREDPTLAFGLFDDPRPEVHLAALTALQERSYWRWDEAAVVLGMAKKTAHPEVRAAAVRAVATADNIDVSLGIIEYLKDPTWEVRAAACESLLAGGPRRWAVARGGVRAVLADPTFLADGPLPGAAGKLSAIAVCDLTAWAIEPPPLSERTARTLLDHFETVLLEKTDPALASELGRQVTDQETPPLLRVELANLLRKLNLLPPDLLDRMTDPDQPSPIRLIAVEAMLDLDATDPAALDVLRGLGRQPNRETALAIARILQQYCQIDFGLPTSGLTPKLAAEVAQRVNRWASGKGSGALSQGHDRGSNDGRSPFEMMEVIDDEDALGGIAAPTLPASVPGINAQLKPRAG